MIRRVIDRGQVLHVARLARLELTDEELRERMSGNLCRCGAYVGIRAAIRDVFESGGPQ